MRSVKIRTLIQQDRNAWESLWNGYIKFYQSTMTADKTEILWQRIHDPNHEIQCRIAEQPESGDLVGLVHFFPHVSTWNTNPVCYLNDLFVSPDARAGGIGQTLINAVVDEAKQQGWDEVYWLTQQQNNVARGLYDKLTGGSEGFVNYSIDTSQ